MDGFAFAKYLAVMAGTTYLIRALPFVLLRKRIQNKFVLSLLYYAPYAVLGAMTLPDILYATGNTASAAAGLVAALVMAYFEKPMVLVAAVGSAAAIAVECVLLFV